jgi:syntaxin 18
MLPMAVTGRSELEARKANPLTRLLPTRLRHDAGTASSDFIAAHHSSITWYLNRRLAEASRAQKEMQEERVRRQMERTKTLGSGVAREAAILGAGEQSVEEGQSSRGGSGGWLVSSLAATIGVPSPSESSQSSPFIKVGEVQPLPDDFADFDEEMELSQSQIMQFESENANILRAVQDTLESVQQAESRLMEISALQMELVTHLTRQTELTDQLYEDAIATTTTAERGNVQLEEARRRIKDSRMFILLFLIGASLSLLFLHYY